MNISKTQTTRIQCLKRLNEKINCLSDIVAFLRSEKIIDAFTATEILQDVNSSEARLYYEMSHALQHEQLLMLDFVWTLLPTETISVTIVTEVTNKSFSYNI